jgi:hypothetical protein
MAADANDAVEFMQLSIEADSDNRALALVDLKFRYGEQWPQYAIASRGLDRPQLTINEMDSYIRQVTNSQRQQRPRIKIHPVNDEADVKIAKVLTGLMRHFEVNSDADHAYDTAFDFAATMGVGYWSIRNDYIKSDSREQDIFIDSEDNPFSIYFDPMSVLPDGSDAEKALKTAMMRKSEFKREYPDANMDAFGETATGDSNPDWVTDHEIRLAEYFFIEKKKAKLIYLSDGTDVWEDQLPPSALLEQAGIQITGERSSTKNKVMWRKQTAYDILDERELPFDWIPIVPVYWTRTKIDNRIISQGMVRPGMDSQRMINFWQTSITESIALAPKAKWLLAEGTDEGHENEFKNANLSSNPVLRYKSTDVDGNPAPAPQRLQPEPPPSGSVEAAFLANQNLQRVMGVFDPNMQEGPAKSGKAVNAERSQSENSNFHGYDNLTRSIKHTARIILSAIPRVLDVPTTRRIIGDDGKPEIVQINTPQPQQPGQPQPDDQAIGKIMNDVRIGTYDVVMDIGPGYDSKRLQGVDSMMQLMNSPIGEKVAQVGDDLIVRQMDFPGSDVLADRLAAANPMSQIDEKSEIPPQVQMQIKQLQQQLQQAQQQLQQAGDVIKSRSDVKKMEEDAETQREHLRTTVKAHDIDTRAATAQSTAEMQTHEKAHDAALGYKKAMDVEEIRAQLALLLSQIAPKSVGDVRGEAVENAV